jgi:hypothetical protein
LALASKALQLDPKDKEAQIVQLSLILEKNLKEVGWSAFPTKVPTVYATAKASELPVLSDALKMAINDGKTDLAAIIAMALGEVTDRSALNQAGTLSTLVDALYAPGYRVQFAAAKALVLLAPTQPFPGSSRIVPTLARFVHTQSLPRALVIDSNSNRGSQLAGWLINLGYDADLEPTGNQGFRAAAERANVSLALISFDLFTGWSLNDTLANFKADSRTAALPLAIYGPLDLTIRRADLARYYPSLRFLVQPADAQMLQWQLKDLPAPLPPEELATYAKEAIALLAQIAQGSGSLLAMDLTLVEPAVADALHQPETSYLAASVLGAIPSPDAQRSLAVLTLDPSQPAVLRNQSAAQLTQNIKRFGPLLGAGQEAQLATALKEEADPTVRASLLSVSRAFLLGPPTNTARQPVPVPTRSPAIHSPAPRS